MPHNAITRLELETYPLIKNTSHFTPSLPSLSRLLLPFNRNLDISLNLHCLSYILPQVLRGLPLLLSLQQRLRLLRNRQSLIRGFLSRV